jgi:superfamily II DNA or RNA helicase
MSPRGCFRVKGRNRSRAERQTGGAFADGPDRVIQRWFRILSIAKRPGIGLNSSMTRSGQEELFDAADGGDERPEIAVRLNILFSAKRGDIVFSWIEEGREAELARGVITPGEISSPWELDVWLTHNGTTSHDFCSHHSASVRALIKRMRKRFPVSDAAVEVYLELARDHGALKAGVLYRQPFASSRGLWHWVARQVGDFGLLARSPDWASKPVEERGQLALQRSLALSVPGRVTGVAGPVGGGLRVEFTVDYGRGHIRVDWRGPGREGVSLATGRIRGGGAKELTWEWTQDGGTEVLRSNSRRTAVRERVRQWQSRFEVADRNVQVRFLVPGAPSDGVVPFEDPAPWDEEGPWGWLEDEVLEMADQLGAPGPPLPLGMRPEDVDLLVGTDFEKANRLYAKRERKIAEAQERLREGMRLAAQKRRDRATTTGGVLRRGAATQVTKSKVEETPPPRAPLPALPVRLEAGDLALQDTAFALSDLRGYFLREQAARYWVSNQTDDLLCLPFCQIRRLDYQVRTALRVIGPLRGRALLSDEVGLGKTIEAGLVLKEYLTRGLVRRFLVLTVPSLVDQWAEELEEKFHLKVATTNDPGFRADPESFWTGGEALVASLHTVKQATQLARAQRVKWDMLIVDEAHYLRNRTSQAWQAVSSLPRQFLLLLTATPVQNSIEELYNLVTLLQPGHLPSPKEFRARFVDPKRPHRPREPDELRRLLWQVMIRNTRSNAGLQLPARRAETVVFEPTAAEASFHADWEREFREALGRLTTSEASLWGRLVLQAIGSSPAAWRRVLDRFPDKSLSKRWVAGHALEESWEHKWRILPPLAAGEGGVVVFTQFLETQSGLARALEASGVPTHTINGQTPPPQRQPITEEFRRQGGALLLTHSGTEGRNLQFCHRLVNFDLPWNPMEIEQRIGRLHRIGQEHVVRIHNLVQAGTLQEQLLHVLQEKLNLFELVVGETGLVLGERYGSDEFAEEVFRRWQENEGRVPEAIQALGDELAAARQTYDEVKQLDESLFAKDFEAL